MLSLRKPLVGCVLAVQVRALPVATLLGTSEVPRDEAGAASFAEEHGTALWARPGPRVRTGHSGPTADSLTPCICEAFLNNSSGLESHELALAFSEEIWRSRSWSKTIIHF